jgi:RNA polymerase sigma-70 factor (sigma-E family)
VLTRGDHVLADDLVQFTFIAAARQWPSVRCLGQAERLGWLRTTIGNLAINAFRGDEAFRDRLPQAEATYRPPPADTCAEARLARTLERWWLTTRGLPPQPHAVAVLRWLFGMKAGEIAAQLGIADGTIAAHLVTVRGKLTADLGPYDPFGDEGGLVMATAGTDTASTYNDELLARLYQQFTDRQAARYAATYDAEAELPRLNAWLREHTGDGAVADAIKTSADTIPVPFWPMSEKPESDVDRAVTELYSAHYRALVRLAVLLVRDTPTAEEVVQDAIVAMHEGWHRLRDAEKALAYLRQAVVNRSRSVLRHRTVADRNPQETPPDMPSAEQGALVLLDRYAVVAALRELPERQREAIVLRYYADLSEAQIAATMGISRGAVKSHTARGMSSLRAVLQEAADHQG